MMLPVRSVTISCPGGYRVSDSCWADLPNTVHRVKCALDEGGVAAKTLRLNSELMHVRDFDSIDRFVYHVLAVSEIASAAGVRWFSVSCDFRGASDKQMMMSRDAFVLALKKVPNLFIGLCFFSGDQNNFQSMYRAAEVVKTVSEATASGYDNFRLGVALNPRADTPFFPYTFASKASVVSIAGEACEYALGQDWATASSLSFEERCCALTDLLSQYATQVDNVGCSLQGCCDGGYVGQDLSLAPFPEGGVCLGDLTARLGLPSIGAAGTYYLTHRLTSVLREVIRRTGVRTTGFNGVMYSVLEDPSLVAANERRALSVDGLVGYSCLCGCGLDMLPIPGSTGVEEIASRLLDVYAISEKCSKPLGVRVLPIPGVEANEPTRFNMDFLCNTKVFPVQNHSFSRSFFLGDGKI